MLYRFLDPINEVCVDRDQVDKCIPVRTPAGVLPLIVLGHLEDRYEQRMKPFIRNYPELNIPWKTIVSNYVKNLNKGGFKSLKTEEDQFVSRTYIEIVDKEGKYLGHFECGVIGKYARMVGKPNKFYQEVIDKYKLQRGGRILTIETYMCLATQGSEMRIFVGKPKTTTKDNLFKKVVMTAEQVKELEQFSLRLIKG